MSRKSQASLYCLDCNDGFYLGVHGSTNLDDVEGNSLAVNLMEGHTYGTTPDAMLKGYFLGYGLNTNVCIKGTVEYCKKFNAYDNLCEEC